VALNRAASLSEPPTAGEGIELSIVVPVYRSASTLRTLVSRLFAALEPLGIRYEIVFVEDCGPDDSWSVLEALHQEHPERITAIQLMRNFGQHNALMCGFRHVRGSVVITMDDDLQNPPEEVPKLYRALVDSKLDLVYGRYLSKKHAAGRNWGSALVNLFYRNVFKTSVSLTSFRAARLGLIQSVLTYDLNYTFVDGLLAWNTQRIGAVDVRHEPRQEGRSGYTLFRLLLLAANLFTNFSILPLQLVSATGFVFALAGLSTGLYYLVQYFLHNIQVPGYASTIMVSLVLGGVQLLALGMLGEYLGRLHLNVNRKPQYVERQALDVQARR
jgi:undecaprenyl-phosphate 4-deoxy-4-formamido-L-arabinose transferase